MLQKTNDGSKYLQIHSFQFNNIALPINEQIINQKQFCRFY